MCLQTSDYAGQSQDFISKHGSTHIVSLLLEPIEWLLRAVSTVTHRLNLVVVGISTTTTRKLGFGDRYVGHSTGYVALEPVHIV